MNSFDAEIESLHTQYLEAKTEFLEAREIYKNVQTHHPVDYEDLQIVRQHYFQTQIKVNNLVSKAQEMYGDQWDERNQPQSAMYFEPV